MSNLLSYDKLGLLMLNHPNLIIINHLKIH